MRGRSKKSTAKSGCATEKPGTPCLPCLAGGRRAEGEPYEKTRRYMNWKSRSLTRCGGLGMTTGRAWGAHKQNPQGYETPWATEARAEARYNRRAIIVISVS